MVRSEARQGSPGQQRERHPTRGWLIKESGSLSSTATRGKQLRQHLVNFRC
jgi:hypothetical protein